MSTPTPPKLHNHRPTLAWRPLDSLTPSPRDPRTYKRADRLRVSAMVERFGPLPMVVTSAGVVISGNIWHAAAVEAGYDEAPVMVADHLSAAEADIVMLSIVKLVERGEWDDKLLGEIVLDLSVGELKCELDLTGFEPAEIDAAIAALNVEDVAASDPADALPDAGPAVTKPGNVWRLGRHRLLCASALEAASFERLMGDERAAIVVTDPPYNVPINGHVSNIKGGARRHREFANASGEMSEPEFTVFLTTVCRLMAQMSAPGSLHFIFMDWGHAFALMAAGRAAYDDMINMCVWAKPGGGMGGLYRSAHELVLIFKHGHSAHQNHVKLGKFGRNRTNVWNYQGAAGMRHGEDGDLTADHPTPKPVRMIADALLDASSRGDVVLDPFLGTGTTLIAAERVGRCCRGLEIDPRYVDLSIRRWQRLTGEDAILEANGATFNTLAEQEMKP